MTADDWISKLGLQPHPEGGFFAETYRSGFELPGKSLPPQYSGSRSVCTAIYYLLRADDISRLHYLDSDEIWHFYAGSPVELVHFPAEGSFQRIHLSAAGTGISTLQYVIPAGDSFGAYVAEGGDYALMGCTVSPGFDFADFHWSDPDVLLDRFPEENDLIRRLSARHAG